MKEEQENNFEKQVLCAGCGKEIDPRRLKAQPGCCRCVKCQAEHEVQMLREAGR